MGQVSAQAGAMAAAAIRSATQAALMGEVAAIVTAPLNKKALQLSGEEKKDSLTIAGDTAVCCR
jgi:4-hydroxythreonine-4-phosphate dehydrogenase